MPKEVKTVPFYENGRIYATVTVEFTANGKKLTPLLGPGGNGQKGGSFSPDPNRRDEAAAQKLRAAPWLLPEQRKRLLQC